MKLVNTLLIILMSLTATTVVASEAIGTGKIEQVRYRGEYIQFKVMDSGNVNRCGQCGPDASGYAGGGYCWVHPDSKVLVSLFLSAMAMDLTVSGRVGSWDSCKLYEFHLH